MSFKDTMKKVNNWLALNMTLAAGTVWCFYLFLLLCFLPLAIPAMQANILYVSNCFQLLLLPIIMVGQTLLGESSDKRAQEDHDMIMSELAEIKDMHAEVKAILTDVEDEKTT